MQATETPLLWRDREAIAERLRSAPSIVLAVDFDGTLAPIVAKPDDASMPTSVREPLVALSNKRGITVAVVSGRSLEDLRERVGIEGIGYAGNHGLELALGDGPSVPARAAEWRTVIAETVSALRTRLADVEGCTVEAKGLTATVHVRRVADEERLTVQEVVSDTVPAIDDRLEIVSGKAIWELRPPIDWDKGSAVEAILEGASEETVAIYLGDDVTDEDAFAALNGAAVESLSVVVGNRPVTAADYRLTGQDAVPDFLRFLAQQR